MQVMFALFLGYVIGHNLWRLWHSRQLPDMNESDSARLSKPLIVVIAGLPTGILAGLLGIEYLLRTVGRVDSCHRIGYNGACA